ncbi:MAG: uroporphyrinogen-III synthase, partial [Proteobacteria bacterium]
AGRENWLHESELVAIGPVTASAITEAGFEPALVAEPHTSQGIVCSIIKWAENRRQG